MGDRKQYLIRQIVHYCQRIDQKGFTANHDGNITLKFGEQYLATPTSQSKGAIVPEMVLTLDCDGKKISGIGNPFSEFKLHIAAYHAREDAKVVIHAHPPYIMARGMVGESFVINVPEAVVSIGDHVPVTPFMMPGAPETDQLIYDALQQSDMVMIPGNGIIVIGADIEQAYLRMELLEHLIKVECYANQMGTPMVLSDEDREKLMAKRASIGLGSQAVRDRYQGGKSTPEPIQSSNQHDALRDLIAREIQNILGDS